MKKNNVMLKVIVVALAIAFAFSTTSCNRGYGCPNNFSVEVSE